MMLRSYRLLSVFFFICGLFPPERIFSEEQAHPVIIVVGTRPEAIKLIPVYEAFQKEGIPALLCSTGQHANLLDDILQLFHVKPDYEFQIMKQNQDLFDITEAVLHKSKELFQKVTPSLVVVQGDTTSAMAAALSAFYLKIPVAHVEAGLRSGNMQAPFPEEMNRRLITIVASYHFAPTEMACSRLRQEGVKKECIFCTGNTVIDALYSIREKINQKKLLPSFFLQNIIEINRSKKNKILLLTAHRRESFDNGLQQIFSAVKKALQEYPNLFVIYPMHPNPAIKKTLQVSELDKMANIQIMPPLPYHELVFLLDRVDGVATDSGGIHEEAVSLHKPVLVLRNETDRPEGIEEGMAELVGTEESKILAGIRRMMATPSSTPLPHPSPFGDGFASQRIARTIKAILGNQSSEDKSP